MREREREGERRKERQEGKRDRGGGEEWKRKQREREISLIALVHPFPLLITFCQFRYIKSSYWEFPGSAVVRISIPGPGTKILQASRHSKKI